MRGRLKHVLRSNALTYGLALAAERLLSFFLLPILTKAISPGEYAIWAQSVVVVGVLTPVVLMGFQTTLVKYFPLWKSTPQRLDSVLLAMFAAILVALFAASASSTSLAGSASELVYGQAEYAPYIPLLAVLLVSEALFEFLLGILRATNRIRLCALYILLKGVWRIGAFLAVLHGTGGDLHKAFLAFVLVQMLFVALMYAKDVPITRILGSGLTDGRAHWSEVLSFSLPLVPLAILTGLTNFTDRFFLTYLFGLEEVAVYAAAFSLAAIAAFFYSVLGFTLFPVLAERWAQGRLDEAAAMVERAMQVYLICLLPFVAGMAVVGQDVMILLTTETYAAPSSVFLLLACNVGLFGLYQIAFYVVLLSQGSKRSLGLMALAASVNVLLNALLVPGMGMVGAALAGLATNALLASATLYMGRRILAWHFPWKNSIRIALRAGVMAGFIWLAKPWLDVGSSLEMVTVLSFAALIYFGLDHLDRRASLLTLLKAT